MRKLLLISLCGGVLPGCSLIFPDMQWGPEGSWFVEATLLSYECSDDSHPDEYTQNFDATGATLWTRGGSGEDTYVFTGGGLGTMTGTSNYATFSFSNNYQQTFSEDDACDERVTESVTKVTGDWIEDNAMSGRVTVTETQTNDDCYGSDDDLSCESVWSWDAIMLKGSSRQHIGDGTGGASLLSVVPGPPSGGGGGYY